MSELSELKFLGAQLGQVKHVRLESLEDRGGVILVCEYGVLESPKHLQEEDVTRFASLLPSMPLESLQIKDFAIDRPACQSSKLMCGLWISAHFPETCRPTPSTLSPILGVLPATCVQLDLCYVLPALPASWPYQDLHGRSRKSPRKAWCSRKACRRLFCKHV